MVHIIYPRTDLKDHPDLQNWKNKSSFKEGDWTALKIFLAAQPIYKKDLHNIPKCWYCELPQGDNYALDVEHFRPKKEAKPLNKAQKTAIEALLGYPFLQDDTEWAYEWLEFDYRNYRLTSALPNRGGAKHVYFPLSINSPRLQAGEYPWKKQEYNLLLDPADAHDASLLVVLADGTIRPSAEPTVVRADDYADLENSWHKDGFNYLRATITIYLYRLQDRVLVEGRAGVYRSVTHDLDMLYQALTQSIPDSFTQEYIGRLFNAVLPSAPFALAARSAMWAYTLPKGTDAAVAAIHSGIIKKIMDKVQNLSNTPSSWE